MNAREHDVLVIGGGIAGLAVAAAIADERRVCIVEREPMICRHASGRAAAMFMPGYGNETTKRLALASRAYFTRDTFRPTPVLHLSEAWTGKTNLHSYAVSPGLARTDLESLLAGVSPPSKWVGMLERGAGLIDLAALSDQLRRKVLKTGRIRSNFEVRTLVRRQGLWSVDSGLERIMAPIVVNAAGPWADEIAAKAGVAGLGLTSWRRTLIDALPVNGPDVNNWPIIKLAEERGYLRPAGASVWACAGEETPSAPTDAQPDPASVATAHARLEEIAGTTEWRVRSAWAGLRTFAQDRSPCIGWADDASGFFWAAGLGGSGIQCAMAIGACARALILKKAWPDFLDERGLAPQAIAPSRHRHHQVENTPSG